MKRLVVTTALLIAAIALCTFELLNINRVSSTMTSNLETINKLVSSGDMAAAKELSFQTFEFWEDSTNLLAIFIQHDSIENIEECLALMNTSLENDEIGSFWSENQKALIQISNLNDTEYPNLENIL